MKFTEELKKGSFENMDAFDAYIGELYRERLEYLSKSEFVNEGYPFFETKIMKKRHKK